MQVHDSLVMQIRKEHFPSVLPDLKRCMEVVVPYDDPLTIPVGIEVSEVSWGDVAAYDWADI
jgi:DNA polymerase I-like protein with 3'-5' exonuclease and polymerase domains